MYQCTLYSTVDIFLNIDVSDFKGVSPAPTARGRGPNAPPFLKFPSMYAYTR